MDYVINKNAKNAWIRDNDDTMDLSPETDAGTVYLNNGRTLEQELGEGSMVSNVVTVNSAMSKVIDGTYDGAYESLVFKGRSLVNLCPNKVIDYVATSDWDGFNGLGQASNTKGYSWKTLQDLKPNTKYFISCYVETFDVGEREYYLFNNNNQSTIFEDTLTIYNTGLHKWVLTSRREFTDEVFIALRCQNAYARGTIKIKNIMIIEYQDGMENWDIPYFEGLCDVKMPVLRNVGKNLCGEINKNATFAWVKSYEWGNDVLKLTLNDGGYNAVRFPIRLSKGNYHLSASHNGHAIGFRVINDSGSRLVNPITLTKDEEVLVEFMGNGGNVEENKMVTFSNIQLEQNTTQTTYEDYKTNILYPTSGEIALAEEMFEQGSFAYRADVAGFDRDYCVNNADSSLNNKRIRAKKLIKIKPNTTYNITVKSTNYTVGIQGFDANGFTILFDTGWKKTNHVFTTPANMYSCNMSIRNSNDSNITPSNFNDVGIQLTEVDKTVTLRSLPNGVKDTLNLMTGEYVQRIGEVVLDGSNDENWEINYSANSSFRYVISVGAKGYNNDYSNIVCDKYQTKTANETYAQQCGVSTNSNGAILFYEPKVQVNDANATTWRAYLQSNPIKVQYELAEPIIKKVEPKGHPFAYESGHVILESGYQSQSLLPIMDYSTVVNRTGQIKSIGEQSLRQDKQINKLEQMLVSNIIAMNYNNTLLKLNLTMNEVK